MCFLSEKRREPRGGSRLPTAVERAVVAVQLGRPLIGGIVGVPGLCSYGQPQVISTYPVVWEGPRSGISGEFGRGGPVLKKAPRPFPTVYWLTCPHLREAVSALESQGMIGEVIERVENDEDFRGAHEAANMRYAGQRMALVSDEDLERLKREAPNMVRVLEETGVGGVASLTGVKCLHMHIADFLAGNSNPVGDMIVSRLAQAGARLECDRGRCVPVRVGAVNAGSNSTKLLVADVVPQPPVRTGTYFPQDADGSCRLSDMRRLPKVFRVEMGARITGLGQALEETGRLSETGRAATVGAIRDFVEIGRTLGVDRTWVTATAAARAARDSQTLIDEVEEACGMRLEVISPKLEAELSFLGVLACSGSAVDAGESDLARLMPDRENALVVDSGGMSTELMRMDSCTGEVECMSIPLGAVSLTDRFLLSDPPLQSEVDKMRAHIQADLQQARALAGNSTAGTKDGSPASIVAVGGSATTLASISLQLGKFVPDLVHGRILYRDEIEAMFVGLCSLACSERMQVRGMIQPKRARVMPAGTGIILGVMELAGVDSVTVSVAGILDGMAACMGLGESGSRV